MPNTKVRRRGTGSIFTKAHSQNWWYSYYDRDGKQVRISSESPIAAVAEEMLRTALAKVGKGMEVISDKNLLYEDVRASFLAYAEQNNLRILEHANVKTGQLYILKHLDKFFAKMRVVRIDARTLDAYIETRREDTIAATKKHVKLVTIKRELAWLCRMLTLAVERGELERIPHFPTIKESKPRTGRLPEADFIKLLTHLGPEKCDDKKHPKPCLDSYCQGDLRPLITFLYRTGCRVGEASELTWSMLNADCTVISAPPEHVKNEENHNIPVPTDIRNWLSKQFRVADKPIFITKNLKKRWEKAVEAIGAPDLVVHDLRRSGISNLTAAGVSEGVAMLISGHKTRSVFDRYNIKTVAQQLDAMAALEKTARKVDLG